MCLEAVPVSRNTPVDSTTTSTPSSRHGSVAGSLRAQTRISRPSTKIASPLAVTSARRVPCTESCLSRWASVFASARSLTPTTSMSVASSAVRKKTRPIRPNPLTPTRTLMASSLLGGRGSSDFDKLYGHLRDTGNCYHPDTPRPGLTQRPRALAERRARREDVVDDDDVAAGDAARRPEGAAHVGAALGRGEVALRSGRPDAHKPARPCRKLEPAGDAAGEQQRLIEAALAFALSREWHRNHRLDPLRERRGALLEREIAERARQSALARELEGVERFPQRPLVDRRRLRALPPVLDALRSGERRDGRRRGAADVTSGGAEASDRTPAASTERVAPVCVENNLAYRAERGEDEVEHRQGEARGHRAARVRRGPGGACSSAGTERSGPATPAPSPRSPRTDTANRTRARAAGRDGTPRTPPGSPHGARRRRRVARGPRAIRGRGPRPSRTGPPPRRASRARGRRDRAPPRGRDRPAPGRSPRDRARSCGSDGLPADTRARAGRARKAPGGPRQRAPRCGPLRGGPRTIRRRRRARAPPARRSGRRARPSGSGPARRRRCRAPSRRDRARRRWWPATRSRASARSSRPHRGPVVARRGPRAIAPPRRRGRGGPATLRGDPGASGGAAGAACPPRRGGRDAAPPARAAAT